MVAEQKDARRSLRHISFGEQVFSRRFDVDDGRLEVNLADADVVLENSSDQFIGVQAYVEASDMEWATEIFEDMDFSATERGNTVYVEADDNKTPRGPKGPRGVCTGTGRSLGPDHISSLTPLVVRGQFEFDFLALRQCAKAVPHHRGEVNEDVLTLRL